MSATGVFSVLPENFFSPLTGANREHYAALLVIYYRLFQESTRGLERELVIQNFMNYLELHRGAVAGEEADAEIPELGPAGTININEENPAPLLDFDSDTVTQNSTHDIAESLFPAGTVSVGIAAQADTRILAVRFLRRLAGSGWLSEEIQGDYTKTINITPYGRPFFEALARVDEGLKTEYESYIVEIYSLLCGDAVRENGHHAVLKAHESTQALIDSLKVLSQSIKGYYDRLLEEASAGGIKGILALQYDEYAVDILDGAYKRLKTSDNLSRYRPKINRQVGELLRDDTWLNTSGRNFARIYSAVQIDGRRRIEIMLEEIRDALREVDPLLKEIDHRNMTYARSCVERVRALLEPDSTIAGKLGALVKEIYGGNEALMGALDHGLHRIRTFAPESLYRRYKRETDGFAQKAAEENALALDQAEVELLDRLRRQLGTKRAADWLDGLGGRDRLLPSAELVRDEPSFIRFVYSLLYADSRTGFDYRVEDLKGAPGEDESAVKAGGYVVPDVLFRRRA
jgi:hypothetical protein